MVEIPSQLKKREINFVLLEKGGKKPFQISWQNKKIKFDDAELINHINSNGNYGVMGGGEKNLIIIDFDDEKIQNEICPKLPKTFTVMTGTKKYHKYFFSNSAKSFKIFNENMDTLADVQGEGKQVVGANSIHPNGNKYKVVDESEITFLSYAEIKALLIPYDRKPQKKKKEFEKPKGIISNNFLETLKSHIRMEDVLQSFGVNTLINPTACPFHNSKGGKCLGFNNEVAHCFHCDGAWNIFSFVKEMKGCDFKEALDYLANLSGLQEEYEKNKRLYLEGLKDSEEGKKRQIRDQFLDLIAGKDKKWAEATELLVDYLKEKMWIHTTKEDLNSEIWIYKEGVYIPQGKSEIKSMLRDLLGYWYSQYIVNLVIAKIETDTYIEPKKFFGQLYRNEIPVLNGILNIFTRELKNFSPEKIFFNKLPINYNPNAKCPKINKFLSDVLSSEEDKKVFYELGGFCLLGEYAYEKAFMFVGDGRNGKDKSLELLKRTFGVENCSAIPLNALDMNSFTISELFQKRVNLAGEISGQDLKDTSTFKALTGRSLISAKRKFLHNISFVNNAKFVFACNELPMVYDTTRAFWDRWVLFEFPYTFVTGNELEKYPENKKLKLRDENIISKITTEEELSGLLNQFLDGLARLEMFKKFSVTIGTEEVKNMWIRKSNSIIAFCMDYLEEDYDGKISKKELRREYSKYCKKHKIPTKSDFVMKRVLQDMFGVSDERENIIGDIWERAWIGIKWKENVRKM